MEAETAIAIAVGSALLGALAAGLVQVLLALWERSTRRRVAARVILGDIYVAEAAFELLIEREEWWSTPPDFNKAAETWERHRVDFAGAVTIADWADVDAFYSNLARTFALYKPGKATPEDLRAASKQVAYAKAAGEVATRHTTRFGRGEQERAEMVERLARQEAGKLPS